MTTKAAERIIEGLGQVLQGFYELRQSVREDLGATVEAGEASAADAEEVASGDPELEAEVEAAVANELRAALETVLEGDEFSSEDLAHAISGLTEALEEVDPDVFAEEAGADDDLDDDYDYDEDDDEDFEELEEDDDVKDE